MATREKFRYYSALSDSTLRDLTTRRGDWQNFLTTAARLYKYSFQDQVMIYAQKPGAVACAEIPLWNEQFNRWVRKGTKGIALIDDSGSYPDLKYVFDVTDTEPSRFNARPVRLWEMTAEYKPLVLAELEKNYEDVDGDSLGATFRNIAKQLANEYYDDNAREILYQAENSALEPVDAYGYDTPIEMVDDSALRAAFVETLSASAAYSVMMRCGLDPSEYFDDDDFRAITDFDTPMMANAIGAATADVSEQVLRDIELTIRKYERVKTAQRAQNAERSEENYDRNPYLQPSGGLSSPQHQTERTAARDNAAAGSLRANEESVSQGTPQDNVQPPVAVGGTVPAPAGGGRTGDGAVGASDEIADGTDGLAGQGGRPVEMGGGDEHFARPSGGTGAERIDLRVLDESEPPEQAQPPLTQPSEPTEPDGFSLPETPAANRHRYYSTQRLISIGTYPRDGGEPAEIRNFDTRTPVENGTLQAWGWIEYDKPLTDKQVRDYELRYVPPQLTLERPDATFSQLGKSSIYEILSTSAVSLAEVDSILRDGGNDKESYLRIAARFAKAHTPEEQAAFLRREYLQGKYSHGERESGKGYDFGNHRVSAWFDKDGISLAVGATAMKNIHRVTIPWEQASERINELMLAGEYADRATFDHALDNERLELAGKLRFFYRDDMHFIPEEWNAEHGGYPEDEALIKSLLDDPDERQGILDRLESDVNQLNYDERVWNSPDFLLANMRESVLPAVIFPNDAYSYKRDFTGFITQDEIDGYLTHDPTEYKLKTLSHYLTSNGDKDFTDYLKDSFGIYGGSTHALGGADNSYAEHSRSKGIKLQRGRISEPYTEVKLNPNQAAKRVKALIESGQFVSRAELDSIKNYEKLELTRNINNFFGDLPEEYERPFPGKNGFFHNEYHDENGERTLNFTYPHKAEWQAINDLLDIPDNVHALLARMEPIYVNTPEEDRYYNLRKRAWDRLNQWRDGTFTLFPGVEHLPDPETAMPRKIAAAMREVQPREAVIDLGDRSPFDWQNQVITPATQITLFDVAQENELPILPSVEEQRTVIDDALKQEAAEVENRENEPFLNISNEDKARLYEAFADNPRSRAAVNLVKEIYGDTLNMSLPQVIQKITELVETGLLDGLGDPYDLFDNVRDELFNRGHAMSNVVIEDSINLFRAQVGYGEFTDVADFIENEVLLNTPELSAPVPQLHLSAVGDFYELTGNEAQTAADILGLTITSRNGEPMVGFPSHVLDDYREQLADAGYALVMPEAVETVRGAEASIEPAVSDPVIHRLVPLYEGVTADINGVQMVFSGTDGTNVSYRESGSRDVAENYREISIYDLAQAGHYFDSSEPNVIIIGGGIPIFNANRTNLPPIYGYITNERGEDWYVDRDGNWLAKTEWQRAKEREQAQAAVAAEPVAIAEPVSVTEPETAAEPLPPLDFDSVARTALERVLSDPDYAKALIEAKTRASLRNPCTWALEQSIRDHENDEPEIFAAYFGDDEFNDNLFDFVLKQSWENRPLTAERTREILYSLVDKMRAGELNYADADRAAEVLKLTLAEYGDQSPEHHYGAAAYAYWNKSGDRRDESAIRVDYDFNDDGGAGKAKNIEIDFATFGIEPPASTIAEQEQEARAREQSEQNMARFRETWADVLNPQAQSETAKEAETPTAPPINYVEGDRLELDLRDMYKNPDAGLYLPHSGGYLARHSRFGVGQMLHAGKSVNVPSRHRFSLSQARLRRL
ncbi:hypothetical protein FACS1894105_05060 [Clostridia bacterium]|nr:hypothetical protein FACS1894105_05060 [Clostridia bacterium]